MSARVVVTLHVAEVNAAINAAAVKAVREAAELLLQVSKDHVPHKDGTLEESGSVDYITKPPTASTFYDTPYAIRLHEHPEYKFKGKGQGKWLFNAKNKSVKQIKATIQRVMKEGLT